MAPELELLLPVLTSYNVTISAVTTRTGPTVTAVLDTSRLPRGTTISDVPIKDIQDRHLATLATQAAEQPRRLKMSDPRDTFEQTSKRYWTSDRI